MNKKGLWVANVYIDNISIIAFVLLTAIFFVLFSLQGSQGDVAIQGKADAVSANIILLNYLKTPVEVDNKTISMSELIALWYNDDDYKDLLISESNNIFMLASYNYTLDKDKYTRYYRVVIKGDEYVYVPLFSKGTNLYNVIVRSKGWEQVGSSSFVPVSLNESVEISINQVDVKK